MPKDDLKEVRCKPNQELIKHVETLLKWAKSGEMQGMAEVVIWEDGTTGKGWRISQSYWYRASTIIGELFFLITKLSNIDEGIVQDIKYLKGE